MSYRRRVAILVLASGAWGLTFSACGGGAGSPTAGAPAPVAPTLTPTTTPTPSAASLSCPLGKGTASATCGRTSGQLLGAVDGAINAVVAAHPSYFNLNEEAGTGQFRVLDRDGLIEGVIADLVRQGMCADRIPTTDTIQLKDSNAFSEQYNVVTTGGFLRRGQPSYQESCTPANFPLDVGESVDRIFVGIYRFRCEAGVVPPATYENRLPYGCDALITATPKDKDGNKVPSWLHSSDVEFWVREGEMSVIVLGELPGEPFNKWIYPKGLGPFSICAAVDGKQTCMNAQVIP